MKIIYTRVSTKDQDHEAQLVYLRDYCDKRGWKDVRAFSDDISGAKFSRIGLNKVMDLVRNGKADTIVCYKLDRLGRSLVHLCQILSELETHKVALVCPSQGIDTTDGSAASRLQISILGAFAQFEREIRKERVDAARSAGKHCGRPGTLQKYHAKAKELLQENLTLTQFAKQLGDIPLSSAHKIRKQLQSAT